MNFLFSVRSTCFSVETFLKYIVMGEFEIVLFNTSVNSIHITDQQRLKHLSFDKFGLSDSCFCE